MKQTLLSCIIFFVLLFFSDLVLAQGTVPEILYYKFDQTGTPITNEASAPPVGTATATINGGLTQGGVGLCQTGLIGTGGSSSSDFVSTGWDTDFGTGSWTIAFWTDNLPNSTTESYQFGDATAGGFRCYTNGAAGSGNFLLRGAFPAVPCIGCAPIGIPSMTVFVYDSVAGDIKSYHNGVLNTTVQQGALNISGTDFKVGGFASSIGLASGQIMDEFRVYDRALGAQEVLHTYNDCLPLNFSDNAGVASIYQPTNFCGGTEDIIVTIQNYGANQIDSCIVQWEINAIAQAPFYFYGLLDTLGGVVGSTTAQFTIGSVFFGQGATEIKAWTELPNGMVDLGTFNDTATVFIQPSLSGNLTIGGVSPDYVDFTSAVADLTTLGICGPTTFDIRTGTYTEQIILDSIPGASAVNTVTFRSEAGHRDSVVLQDLGIIYFQNFTLKFHSADHISIEQITIKTTITSTYANVLIFEGGSDYNTIWDCRLIGGLINFPANASSNSVIYSDNFSEKDQYNSFIHNTLENGHRSIYWYGGGTSSFFESGNVFKDNILLNSIIGTNIVYQDGLVFENNVYISNLTNSYIHFGVQFSACRGMNVSGNTVRVGPNRHGYGMLISTCSGTASQPALVSNNMIVFQSQVLQNNGFGLTISDCDHLQVINNSVYVQGLEEFSRAFYSIEGGENELKNNIFVMDGPGVAARFATEYSISASDHNNFYATGPNLIYHVDSFFPTLPDYVTHTLLDSNSISVDPLFYSFEDLHVCNDSLDGAGTPLSFVTTDFDGQARNVTNPDIGADEFGPSADGVLCTGDVLTLWAGSPSDNILWSTGDTTQSVTVSAPGTYFVDYTGVCGTGSDTIIVEESALIYTDFVQADTTFFCIPGSATLSSTIMGTAYDWSTTETTPTISVTASGTYFLTLTDACGTGMDSVIVVGAFAPVASFTDSTSYETAFFTNTTLTEGTTTYAWDFGDGNTSATENPTHVYSVAGTYTVTLTVTNECGTDVITNSVTVSTVGLDEIENGNSLSIYPNPNNGTFTLDILLTEKSSVELIVTNELGQKIYTNSLNETVGSQLEMIDLGKVESGLYFITVLVNESPYVSKFVVK